MHRFFGWKITLTVIGENSPGRIKGTESPIQAVL